MCSQARNTHMRTQLQSHTAVNCSSPPPPTHASLQMSSYTRRMHLVEGGAPLWHAGAIGTPHARCADNKRRDASAPPQSPLVKKKQTIGHFAGRHLTCARGKRRSQPEWRRFKGETRLLATAPGCPGLTRNATIKAPCLLL